MSANHHTHTQPKLVEFYEHPNGGIDFRGRTLSSILQWRDDELEYSHNYIQVLFPLPEGSPFNSQAPIVDKATFDAFHSRPELRARLRDSFVRMLHFYGFKLQETDRRFKVSPARNFSTASKKWVRRSNHNHLRITRIIRSLRVLGLEEEAEAFFVALEKLCQTTDGGISSKSLMFWTRAASRPLYLTPEDEEDEGDGAGFLYEFEEGRNEDATREDVEAKISDSERAAAPGNSVVENDEESVSKMAKTEVLDRGLVLDAKERTGSGEATSAKRKIDKVESPEVKG